MFLFLEPALDPVPEIQSCLAVTGALSLLTIPRGQFRSESLHCHSIAEFALYTLVISRFPPPTQKKAVCPKRYHTWARTVKMLDFPENPYLK